VADELAVASGEELLRAALKQIARQAETGAARSEAR
jgi:hypothetical protein